MNPQLEALERLSITTAPTPDEVWTSQSSYHVASLHPDVSRRLLAAMDVVSDHRTPTISVVRGDKGAGKTHLLGWTRQQIQSRSGFFFYIKLVTGRDFWESATGSLVDSLYRKDDGGHEQLLLLLDELARRAGLDNDVRAAVIGERELTRAHLDSFVSGIRRLDRQVGNEAGYTARALALVASAGMAVEAGTSYFALNDDELEQRTAWGLPSRARSAQLVLRDLTRLFALVGPLVFAFDQLDHLVEISETSENSPSSAERSAARRLSLDIAAGLMELREETRRTLMVVACQSDTWQKISKVALGSALDRIDLLPELGAIPDRSTAEQIVARRFQAAYAAAGFAPPSPTWPIGAAALAEAPHRYTVRRLLSRIAEHVKSCLDSGAVVELTSLAPEQPAIKVTLAPEAGDDTLTERFEDLRREADIASPFAKETEDRLMPGLIGAGLKSLVLELDGDSRCQVEIDFGRNPALHATLHYSIAEDIDDDIRWSFRAISAEKAVATQARMRNAMNEAELTAGSSDRHLTLLRNTPYPGGPKSDEMKDDFLARGGSSVPFGADDVRTFTALRELLATSPPGLGAWLKQARPASRSEVLAGVQSELRRHLGGSRSPDHSENDSTPPRSQITIGVTKRGTRPFTVAARQLRMHTAVIGAAGSGKTVLIKRIVEQCALQGVSAIVLDPNDDLGRLGDRWPSTPDEWTEEHEADARRYFSDTEVMVWTPGLNRGRPLSFHPLPDFGPVLGDSDDFTRLLASTVATLAPPAGVRGNGPRATRQLGILKRVLNHYVRDGGQKLAGFVELLGEPPPDTVNSRMTRLAVEMADTLEASMETDPLFGESGAPADPGLLLTPSTGKKSRISVISFVGLSGDAPARFVSRLQAALFSWFRAHPAGDSPLGGLLVMDEAQNFVPSGSANPSTESTVELIRQIRKYGLGIVLASQAPRSIHHQTVGNTANQFLGRLTAQAQIDAAKAMAASRTSVVDDLGRLGRGTFYAAGEGTGFSKIEVPICLSHHTGPLHEEEVVERARRT
ncbi:helicase HerA domain-containing protein [Amycolatopsis sp. NPDC098790]|uniref:helicase HerA domain-containing protein n=1 Tax=Amycolatopsis sp. NPDC098790 TaxID=3363939 RepID=UPI0037F57A3C